MYRVADGFWQSMNYSFYNKSLPTFPRQSIQVLYIIKNGKYHLGKVYEEYNKSLAKCQKSAVKAFLIIKYFIIEEIRRKPYDCPTGKKKQNKQWQQNWEWSNSLLQYKIRLEWYLEVNFHLSPPKVLHIISHWFAHSHFKN